MSDLIMYIASDKMHSVRVSSAGPPYHPSSLPVLQHDQHLPTRFLAQSGFQVKGMREKERLPPAPFLKTVFATARRQGYQLPSVLQVHYTLSADIF